MHECRQADAGNSQHARFSFVQVWTPLFSWHTKQKIDSFVVPVLNVIVPVLAVAQQCDNFQPILPLEVAEGFDIR